QHLGSTERWTGDVFPGGVADEASEVADEKHHLVAEVLKAPHPAEEQGVAEVEVRAARVKARLYDERLLLLVGAPQLGLQLLSDVQLDSAAGDFGKLLVGRGTAQRRGHLGLEHLAQLSLKAPR